MTDPLSLDALAAALARRFPGAGPTSPLAVLGEGFSSLAVETPAGVVFRVARVAGAGEGYRRELRLLPLLRGRLPAAVPGPRWHAEASPGVPHGVIGYPKLPGRPVGLDDAGGAAGEELAGQVGRFLAALHRVPLSEIEAIGLGRSESFDERMERLRDDTLPALRERLSGDEVRTVARWWDGFLADRRMRGYAPVLMHGDVWHGNLLMDERGRLTAVLDWEDAGPGDPAEDFAAQMYLGPAFPARSLAAYRAAGGVVDADFAHRVGRLWEANELGGVQFAAVHHDEEEMDDALAKLRAGPILNPAAPRFG
jgi:aminoglycoside 2''-phosphotransferase